jgi:nitroreductase
MNPVVECIASHRTIRKFKREPLAEELVHEAVRAAQMAATSSHVQAYSLLWVQDAEKRARLVELTGDQPQVGEAGAFFVVCADQRRHRLMAERAGRDYRPNFETFLTAVIDASLFAQNLVLAFESLGLGTCYIGGLRNRLAEADRLLGLPGDLFPLFGLCAGEPDEEPSLRPRLPLDAVLSLDAYPGDADMLASIRAFDERMREYYAARGKGGHDWSGGVTRRFAKAQRDEVLEVYRSKGASF